MNTKTHDRQKAADAAFFEDWSVWANLSAWANLDDLPPPPQDGRGRRLANVDWKPYGRYRLELRHRVSWIGGAAFELVMPTREPVVSLIRRVPGARQHPALNGPHRTRYSRMLGTWFVPAEHWRELRAVLPAIKAAITSYVRSRP